MKPSLLMTSRWGFFVVAGLAFGARDMCFGSGGPPPPDPEPADAAPEDASPDGPMSQTPAPSIGENHT